jgi:hypothetical protein
VKESSSTFKKRCAAFHDDDDDDDDGDEGKVSKFNPRDGKGLASVKLGDISRAICGACVRATTTKLIERGAPTNCTVRLTQSCGIG